MSVISIRLNEEEKSILNELSKVYDTSISSMIKKLAFEKLEDNFDLELVTRYEKQKLNQILNYRTSKNYVIKWELTGMSYKLKTTNEFNKEFKKLDPSVQKTILSWIKKIYPLNHDLKEKF